MNQINEKTEISLPLKAVYLLSICFASATFWLAGIYGEAKDILASRHEDRERISKLERNDSMTCRVLKRIQDNTVPAQYRETMICD